MKQNYYDPRNLELLKAIDPFLHYQLEHMSFRIHDSWQALISGPDIPAADTALILLDLVDLTDRFTDICWKSKMVYEKRTGKPFFNRIEEYSLRRTKIGIALAMYDDLFQ
ncbi:hypothetical protein [Lacrimispora sp. 210928-DFI.3.58]|uniref:hypothetical protein n=1 Tax=Lacrimispora sp. 210928-DFI.3.58 TaxID=2883214 RepID=UPI001D06D194|nr:hypothetical protein [Lacrimispora sp. 210928-DFI.3.58]MCB7319910.1 hypothetical protein [Lacrimispora sp. 210928-DFI.3.58]